MTKKTQTLIGVAAVGIVGYLIWKQMSKSKTGFANLVAPESIGCPCKVVVSSDANFNYCSDGKVCRKKGSSQTLTTI